MVTKRKTLEQLRQEQAEAMNRQAEHPVVVERKNKYRDLHKDERNLQTLVNRMQAAQAKKEDLEAQLKEANAEFDVLRIELVPTLMEDQGVENVRYEGVGRVSLTADVFVSTNKSLQPGLFAWFKKRKLGDLIQPTVNSSTLRAFVKDRIKAGKEIPEEFLNVTPYTRASITKG